MVDEHNEEGMIALLPTTTDWCKIPLPHMTVVYLGHVADLPRDCFSILAKRASSLAQVMRPITCKVMETEVLGEEEKVNTLRLEPSTQLLALREIFDEWDESEYDFHPHCTIGPADGLVPEFTPMYLTFDRLMVAWGDESLTFGLN